MTISTEKVFRSEEKMLNEAYTKAQLDKIIASTFVVIVAFLSATCSACIAARPKIEKLAEKHDVVIVADKQLMSEENIEAVPTVRIYREGQLLAETVGYDENKIRTLLDGKPKFVVKPVRYQSKLTFDPRSFVPATYYLSLAAITKPRMSIQVPIYVIRTFDSLSDGAKVEVRNSLGKKAREFAIFRQIESCLKLNLADEQLATHQITGEFTNLYATLRQVKNLTGPEILDFADAYLLYQVITGGEILDAAKLCREFFIYGLLTGDIGNFALEKLLEGTDADPDPQYAGPLKQPIISLARLLAQQKR